LVRDLEDLEEAIEDLPSIDFCNAVDATSVALMNQQKSGHISGGKVLGSLLKLDIPQRVVVIGDIHGDYAALSSILYKIKYKEYLSEVQNKLIFLGDYVDRGSRSPEVLYSVCFLKSRFPESVILMRGNHEAPAEFPFPSHDFPLKMRVLYGQNQAKSIYNLKILPLFRALCLSVIIDNSFVLVHGGVPTDLPQDRVEAVETLSDAQASHLSKGTMEEILWNDPRDFILNDAVFEHSRRGIGKHFGRHVSSTWLKKFDAKVILRGHEPCEGYKINHQGLVFTIFSCKESYPLSKAAYIDIHSDEIVEVRNGYDLQQHLHFV
jgi:hypothetical protein